MKIRLAFFHRTQLLGQLYFTFVEQSRKVFKPNKFQDHLRNIHLKLHNNFIFGDITKKDDIFSILPVLYPKWFATILRRPKLESRGSY